MLEKCVYASDDGIVVVIDVFPYACYLFRVVVNKQ